jgi:hypothetical protein
MNNINLNIAWVKIKINDNIMRLTMLKIIKTIICAIMEKEIILFNINLVHKYTNNS